MQLDADEDGEPFFKPPAVPDGPSHPPNPQEQPGPQQAEQQQGQNEAIPRPTEGFGAGEDSAETKGKEGGVHADATTAATATAEQEE